MPHEDCATYSASANVAQILSTDQLLRVVHTHRTFHCERGHNNDLSLFVNGHTFCLDCLIEMLRARVGEAHEVDEAEAPTPRLPKYATIRLLEQDAAHLWAAWDWYCTDWFDLAYGRPGPEHGYEPTMAHGRIHEELATAAGVPPDQYRKSGLTRYMRAHVLRKD